MASVTIHNRSQRSSYDVVVDGSILTTVPAGSTSSSRELAPGSHDVRFRFSGTSQLACSPATVVLVAGSSYEWTCSADRDCSKAEVRFRNGSQRSRHEVLLDGALVATLAPGETSEALSVAAGPHSLAFRFAGSGEPACRESTVSLVGCQSAVWSCAADEPDCRIKRTAVLTFENRSTRAVYDVYLDGSFVVRLWPGGRSDPLVVNEGTRMLSWYYSSGGLACTGPISVVTCENVIWFCRNEP